MNFKKNWKRFCDLSSAREGFTLVELIVVIAILAILAGVAVPAYSGYVKKANKGADQTLVGEVMHALTLRYYAEGLEGTAAVILTRDGAYVADGNEFAQAAMDAAFGAGWEDTLSLSYDWGNGTVTSANVINAFSNETNAELIKLYNGEYAPSFANDVDNLFEMVKDTSTDIFGDDDAVNSLLGAAGTTTNALDAQTLAEYWATGAWDSSYLMGSNSGDYGENATELTGSVLDQAVANAAVIKARNTALAGYLRDNGYPELYDVFANYNYGDSIVPMDSASVILGDNVDQETALELESRINAALAGKTEDEINAAYALIDYYYLDDESTGTGMTAAYMDGLAYYAMMDTVGSVDATSEETYWDEMKDAVSLYGAIAQGKTSLDDLKNIYGLGVENGVVVIITSDGTVKSYCDVFAG